MSECVRGVGLLDRFYSISTLALSFAVVLENFLNRGWKKLSFNYLSFQAQEMFVNAINDVCEKMLLSQFKYIVGIFSTFMRD